MKESDVRTRKKFQTLDPLLNQWVKIHEDYPKRHYTHDPHPLYLEVEVSDVGVLSGAIYRCGEFSLQEVKVGSGRCDLIFTWKKNYYAVEAKSIGVSLVDNADSTLKEIEKFLQEAVDTVAGRKWVNLKPINIGLVFVIGHIPKKQLGDTEGLLKRFISLIDDVDYDFMAYVFPKAYRSLDKIDDYSYPAVVLFGRGA